MVGMPADSPRGRVGIDHERQVIIFAAPDMDPAGDSGEAETSEDFDGSRVDREAVTMAAQVAAYYLTCLINVLRESVRPLDVNTRIRVR